MAYLEDDEEAEKIRPEAASPVRRFFFFLGPIMAGFHVATYITAFFSVGAVAKSISEQWFPFTRWVWTQILAWASQYVRLPQFDDVEKDALTTLFFFAPLGLYALFFRKNIL